MPKRHLPKLANNRMIRLRNRRVLARQKRSVRYIIKDWSNRLKDVPAFILGNGPSLVDENLSVLDDYLTIGINRCFASPANYDPTVLFWQDIGLWNAEHNKLHNLQCLKVCRDISDPRHIYYNFYLRGGQYRFDNKTHILNGRGSTGPIAVEFAYALGCKPIILLGMDCKCREGNTDFYGVNTFHRPHTLSSCIKGLEFIKSSCPVPIINCSENDIFKTRHPLSEVLSLLDKKYAMGRQKYVSLLVKGK